MYHYNNNDSFHAVALCISCSMHKFLCTLMMRDYFQYGNQIFSCVITLHGLY